MRKLAQIVLKLLGWKYEALTPDFDKCVLLVAPHTSNWDFILGKLGYTAMGRNANFVIKNEWMKGPLGFIFKKLGGIGVDRSKASRFTDQIADIYETRDKFSLAITPEGTRQINSKWKKGFYHIALKAQIPIVLVVIDYEKKYMALFDVFIPTGEEQADIKAIQQKYKGATGKYPEKFSIGE